MSPLLYPCGLCPHGHRLRRRLARQSTFFRLEVRRKVQRLSTIAELAYVYEWATDVGIAPSDTIDASLATAHSDNTDVGVSVHVNLIKSASTLRILADY